MLAIDADYPNFTGVKETPNPIRKLSIQLSLKKLLMRNYYMHLEMSKYKMI